MNFTRGPQTQKIEVVNKEYENLIASNWVEEYNCMRKVEVR